MPKPKGAGDLRQRVYFQRFYGQPDNYGNEAGDWYDLDIRRPASLTPTRGGEALQAGRMTGTAMWDCWLRSDWRVREITDADRLIDCSGRIFNIRFIGDMDGGGRWLLMQLESGVAT